jgi:tetratricopeptide (TPR) repeat protein
LTEFDTLIDISETYARAKNAFDCRDWAEAANLSGACLDAFPEHQDAPYWRVLRANALTNLGRLDEAETDFVELIENCPDMPSGYTGYCRVAQLRQAWPEACERLDACLRAFPTHPSTASWRNALARALTELGRYDEAEEAYRAVVTERGSDVTALIGMARVAQLRKDWPEAADRWRLAIRNFPGHTGIADWRRALAAALLEADRSDEAEAEYRILMSERADDPAAFVALARIAESRRDWPAAADRWQTLLEHFPNADNAARWRASLAATLVELRQHGPAEQVYRALIIDSPDAASFANFARVAQMREDWAEACVRWKDSIARFPDNPNAIRWQGSLGGALIELGRLEEAEAVCRALSKIDPESPTGLIGLARIAQKQELWAEAVVHWQDALAKFPPGRPAWHLALANALEKTSRWKEALQTWDRAIEENGPDRETLLGRARCLNELNGASEDAEKAVAAVLTIAPDDFAAACLHALIAHQRGDAREEFERRLHCISLRPRQVSSYQSAMEAAGRCEDFVAVERVLSLVPEDLAGSVEFRSRVLLTYYRLTSEIDKGLNLIKGLEFDPDLDLVASGVIGYFLHWSYQFPALLDFTSRLLERFGSDPTILRLYLGAIFQVRGRDALEAEKHRLLASLDDGERASVLRRLDPTWLTFEEVKLVVDNVLADTKADARRLRPLLNLGYRRDSKTLRYLAERMASRGDRGQRFATALLLATVEDRRVLDYVNLGSSRWEDLRASAGAISSRFDDFLAGVQEDGEALAKVLAAANALKRVMQRFRTAWVFTAESYYETACFAQWLAERIRNRVPTSVVRLSEGEGTFLPYAESVSQFQEPDQRALQQMWWGQARILGDARDDMMRMFAETVLQADAIGVSPPRRLVIDLQNSQSPPSQRGLLAPVGFLDGVDPAVLDNKVLTSCHIHADLNAWDLYRTVLAGLSSVSVVSCHDLARPLAMQFGLDVREWFPLPPEFKFADMFTDVSAREHEHYYPTVFERVLAEVAPLPGEVYLVAAGFLGKIMCTRIRERGGIGIDIGGVGDQWAGYVTRRGTVGDLDFDVSSSLLRGQPFTDTFQPQAISRAEPCRSDRTRRHNLAGRFDAVLAPDTPVPEQARYALRVIGHPRCGARDVVQGFNRVGIWLGHQKMARDGVCGWIHAVEDLNPPYAVEPVPAQSFELTIAFVRDPAIALPWIMLENCRGASFAFRRFHIARLLGNDIATWQNPVERAVDAYLSWMDIIDRQHPVCTLRVERLIDDLTVHRETFVAAGIVLDRTVDDATAESTPAVPTEYDGSAELEISETQYHELPAILIDRLRAFSARHGYAMPGGL